MINSAVDTVRDEPGKALAAMIGVLLIVGLLWAIGHVVQGQVLQAQARGHNQLQAQAMALRCGPPGAVNALGACADRDEQSAGGEVAAVGRPVYVSYR